MNCFINRGGIMAELLFAGLTYEAVVRKYAQTVTGVCVMRLQNYADAEDCFQNTFLRLLSASPCFRDEEHLKSWLIRVAIHECYNYIKKNRKVLYIHDLTNEPIYDNEDKNDISWAMMKLDTKYREILYLHYCEKYKINEIAEILGRKPNTVKVMLKRGREKLKKIYAGEKT